MEWYYICPCCGEKVASSTENGYYEICPNCFWENDPLQSREPSYEGGANDESLIDARWQYLHHKRHKLF